jgi:glycine/D-amino acid oxidase-like deaminating enzyme
VYLRPRADSQICSGSGRAVYKPIALIRDEDRLKEIVARWQDAGVQYQPCSSAQVAERFPRADLSRVAAAFEVADLSINTRLLYRKLLAVARRNGAEIVTGAELASIDDRNASVKTANDDTFALEADVFVYVAGFGARDLFRSFFGIELPIRYWKSHLVISRRLGEAGLFYLDAHEAAMMHHRGHSIVGLNEDAVLCDEATYTVVPEKAANLHRALDRLVPGWSLDGYHDVACTKVDLAPSGAARSLNIAIAEPVEGHICVLPGKMTEAPFVTDALV